jgi:hypothetical protein
MKLCDAAIRTAFPIKLQMRLAPLLVILLFLLCAGPQLMAQTQERGTATSLKSAPLTTQQVVKNLVGMNLQRAHALHAYQGTRTYRIEYRGLPSGRNAEMVVDVKFVAPGRKDFTIRSSTGSKMLIERVFKKLLEAERDSQTEEAQKRTALNSDNYDFKMLGYESTPSGSTYVLIVEPKTSEKYLYRGKIWVDAEDFAVVKLQAEPAKNPSFWIRNSEIEHAYTKINDFWLPAHNHTVTSIRLGGRADLTVEYSNYQITAADAVRSLPTLEAAR